MAPTRDVASYVVDCTGVSDTTARNVPCIQEKDRDGCPEMAATYIYNREIIVF